MPDTEVLLRQLLDEWKAGIDGHDPDRVAAVFTEDAIFQGLRPFSVGRQGVYAYYESQPVGLTVDYRFHETRRPADGVALGYLRADFTGPDGTAIPLNLSVLATLGADGWKITFYQVSPAQG
ncbi:hypothetical protein A5784_26940 [Mycobacterium sp. 852013-50091_SCH5140682]|uniref:YybH family protein n=1 Tax=Mycobacterium sp. 852013-50091_SCH5140682 TaxID=1834109 RepID=UPI0007EB104D|nr:SgcJ/EcaC family oxidoreductase [Mycobacterium sp. 852013-50091_SCH5140682]OBC16444.1 hypothetical protein A5784_26940 [Mycobacterium sp. 852013-50091_SCH5140682]